MTRARDRNGKRLKKYLVDGAPSFEMMKNDIIIDLI